MFTVMTFFVLNVLNLGVGVNIWLQSFETGNNKSTKNGMCGLVYQAFS